jgi:DUF971 family protein
MKLANSPFANTTANSPTPLTIHNHPQERCVMVQWSKTEIQHLSWVKLRGACPCAGCRANRLRGTISLIDADIEVTAINNMLYGVQIVFSDGHDRGIFPWVYLAGNFRKA